MISVTSKKVHITLNKIQIIILYFICKDRVKSTSSTSTFVVAKVKQDELYC